MDQNTSSTPGQPAKPEHRPLSRERLALLFTVMLVTAAGNTAMQSVMPSIGRSLEVNDVWISLAYSWSALLWVICAPFWARRSDKRGRKAMMALGLTGFVVSMTLCGIALWAGMSGVMSAFWALIAFAAARSLFGGFGSAAPPAVQAYVASRTPRAERTNALSLVASSFGVGTVLGPALAPLMVLPFLGLTGPFFCFAALALLALILLRLRLPDDVPQFAAKGSAFDAPYASGSTSSPELDEDDGEEDIQPRTTGKLRWTDTRIRPWVVAGILGGHAQAMIMGIIGFLVIDRSGYADNPTEAAGSITIVLMIGAMATLLAQWGLIPRLRLGPKAATLSGIAIGGLGIAILGGAQELHLIVLGFSVASLGFGLFRPGTTAGTSLAVTRREQGEASGVVAAVAGASFIYAPALGVGLYNISDWLGFGLAIVLCVIVFAIGYRTLQADGDLTKEAP